MEQGKIIYEIRTGSHLYGTNTPESDEDFVGIFMPNKEFVLGLNECQEIDKSKIIKDKSGKNTKEAIDRKFYNYRKFVKLAIANNPNILELLFADEKNIIYKDGFADRLLEKRHLFPYKGLVGKFIGYSSAQKHKMIIKLDNYSKLEEFLGILNNLEGSYLIAEYKALWSKHKFKYDKKHVRVGDLCIPLNDHIKKASRRITERLDKATNRRDLFTKYGFDTKFGAHLIRLLMEGKELLLTGELQFPLKEKDFILDIRNGKYTKEQIISMAEELEKEIDSAKEISKLPSEPRFREIDKLLIKEMLAWIN